MSNNITSPKTFKQDDQETTGLPFSNSANLKNLRLTSQNK
jgi:hypothetical protein